MLAVFEKAQLELRKISDANAYMEGTYGFRSELFTLAKTLAQEEAKNGITVNTILPGVIQTGTPTPRESALLERIPAGRLGSAREVARAALFLVAEESGYITGAALPVSGGFLI
jgi:NAD(P)-dependent dehydrogenase (short-subunit alcohol dehydrogenase family)